LVRFARIYSACYVVLFQFDSSVIGAPDLLTILLDELWISATWSEAKPLSLFYNSYVKEVVILYSAFESDVVGLIGINTGGAPVKKIAMAYALRLFAI